MPPARIDGFPDHVDFTFMIRIGYVVHLHEIYAPRRVQFEERIVVCLRTKPGRVYRIHIAQPLTQPLLAVNIPRCLGSAEYRSVLLDRQLRYASHDVDTELQSEAVYVIRQRLETLAIGGRWKSIDSRHEPAVFIHIDDRIFFVVTVRTRILDVPAYIYNDVHPPVFLEMGGNVVRVRPDFLFSNSGSETVPTVPSHRRSRRPSSEVLGVKSCRKERKGREQYELSQGRLPALVSQNGL